MASTDRYIVEVICQEWHQTPKETNHSLLLYCKASWRPWSDITGGHTQITRFLNCISSRDKALQDIAWSQLAAMVRTRQGIKDISTADNENFLNQPPQPQERSRRDVRSLWSSVRNSLSHMSCPVKLDGSDVSLVKSEISLEARQRETVKKSLMEV